MAKFINNTLMLKRSSYVGILAVVALLAKLLFTTDGSGLSVLTLYFWAQGQKIAETLQPWLLGATLISLVIGVINAIAYCADGQGQYTKLWMKYCLSLSAAFGLLTLATVLAPTTTTLNFIHERFNPVAIPQK